MIYQFGQEKLLRRILQNLRRVSVVVVLHHRHRGRRSDFLRFLSSQRNCRENQSNRYMETHIPAMIPPQRIMWRTLPSPDSNGGGITKLVFIPIVAQPLGNDARYYRRTHCSSNTVSLPFSVFVHFSEKWS